MLRRAVADPNVPLFSRLIVALQTFFRIVADGRYAGRVLRLESDGTTPVRALPTGAQSVQPVRDLRPALQLLSVLQREGRLVDFVQQDILSFSDADVGVAARVVHEGCRRALQRVVQFAPVQDEMEGNAITVPEGYDATRILLTGNVSGTAPFRGVLRHRGWRASTVKLPDIIGDIDCTLVAPAEVEL